jgi:hypothetical protein
MRNLLTKLMIFVVAAPMALFGLYVLIAELLLVHHIYFRFVLAGIVLLVLGGALLWVNFLAPLLGYEAEG